MALFGNSEEKQLKRQAEQRKQMEAQEIAERQVINSFDGKYISIDFDSQDWSNTNSMIISKVYRKITEYANRHNLKIVNISRIEDGALKTVTVSVIFEK